MHNMDSLIHTEDICMDFKSSNTTVRVLDHINMDIPNNTLTLFQGRSGSGKTTLINILGALSQQTKGQVFYRGKDMAELSIKQKDALRRREISFIFQSVSLFPHLSAYDNVEFMLRIAKLPIDKTRILYCLGLLGLHERIGHPVTCLSGGEQQRVAIARAIVHKPKLIYADEPTSQLDSNTSAAVYAMLRQYLADEKASIVISSHDPEASMIADYVYTIEDGKILSFRQPNKKAGSSI